MSYIRSGWDMEYVDAISNDYIFSSVPYGKHKTDYIEDYGKISNEAIIEILFQKWDTDDTLLKEYLLKKLAEKLNVKLRKKPLTPKQIISKMSKRVEEYRKEMGDF